MKAALALHLFPSVAKSLLVAMCLSCAMASQTCRTNLCSELLCPYPLSDALSLHGAQMSHARLARAQVNNLCKRRIVSLKAAPCLRCIVCFRLVAELLLVAMCLTVRWLRGPVGRIYAPEPFFVSILIEPYFLKQSPSGVRL